MTTKTTLRLPDEVARELKALSASEGRSLNDTAVRALQRGLGTEPDDDWWRIFGDLVAVPPTRGRFDVARMRERRNAAGITLTLEDARGLLKALDETREDRF
jgi:hypothetical protein